MKPARFVHWIAVGCLGFYILRTIVRFDPGSLFVESIALSLWGYLGWMLFIRPRSWGLGVGMFMLATTGVQFGLWRLAINSPKKEELGLDDSWLSFAISGLPLVLGGIAAASLRWIAPAAKPSA